MKIVGKASQNPQNGPIDYVEYYLPAFRNKLQKEKAFVYAWTFHPDEEALWKIEEYVSKWLYLIGEPNKSPLKMEISDLIASDKPLYCPNKWNKYCIKELMGKNQFEDIGPIKLWLLITNIIEIYPPEDIKKFNYLFQNRYHNYGRNFFGFYM